MGKQEKGKRAALNICNSHKKCPDLLICLNGMDLCWFFSLPKATGNSALTSLPSAFPYLLD